MTQIENHSIQDTLYESRKSHIYRSEDTSTGRQVVIKQLNLPYPTSEELGRFRLEYSIANELDFDGVVKADALFPVGNSLAFSMGDDGGISLDKWAGLKDKSLPEVISIFVQLAEIVEQIHQRRVIHKDINPSNILHIPSKNRFKLIDFGIASRLQEEHTTIQNPGVLEGTLHYISPEQTGRMNRTLDYRSDYYSLGATYYALLAGHPPFQSDDPLAIVHAHIAVQPRALHEVDPNIPAQLGAIVNKLLAKTAENRYQSTFGLIADLNKCADQLSKGGKARPFPLGEHDIADNFQISQKLYGREEEIQQLLAAFDRTRTGRSELMLVAGAPGIGKSALINEVQKPIAKQRGYFASGKFDQLQRNIPYSAIIQAIQDFIKQILTESAERIEHWKNELLEALGPNGQVVIDVVPELGLILGEQPPVPPLGIIESQNRLNLVFRKLIGVFANEDHPLVLFLDDLQWADSGSLGMLQLLVSDAESRHLFLIGAYRDNEITDVHPLSLALDAINDVSDSVSTLTLSPLTLQQVNILAADSLNRDPATTADLAEHILTKTEGNPFFINQFLMSLDQEGLLSFDRASKTWLYQIQNIQKVNFTDNVVELTANKIQRLPEHTQDALQLAACIGGTFDLLTLSTVREQSQNQTSQELWPAIQEGLIHPIGDTYRLFQEGPEDGPPLDIDGLVNEGILASYQFLHDRVQQAAYSLISDVDKEAVHLRIGQLRLPDDDDELLSEQLFDILHHLNIGRQYIDSESERHRVANLNLIAGSRAKEASAFQPAQAYLETGIDLLSPNCWSEAYDLALSLHVEAAEAAYLNTAFDQTEKYATLVFDNATVLLDKVRIHEIRIQSFMAQHKMREAVDEAIAVLKLLDVQLPSEPNTFHILQGFVSTKLTLRGKSIEDLKNLPVLEDQKKLAAMRILMEAAAPVYFAAPKLFPLLVFSMVKISVKHGNAPISAFAYNMLGVLLCGAFGDIPGGYEFGQFGIDLYNKFQTTALKSKVYMVFFNSVKPWKDPIAESLPNLLEGYQSGLETGDLEYAAINGMTYCTYSFINGNELEPLEKEMAGFADAIAKMKQEAHLQNCEIFWQIALNLLGKTDNPSELAGTAYTAESRLPKLIEANDNSTLCRVYISQLFLKFLFGDHKEAAGFVQKADALTEALLGTAYLPFYHFYAALVLLQFHSDMEGADKKTTWKKIKSHQKKIKNWSDHAPANHLHRYQLIAAEMARVQGKNDTALDLYDEAIVTAKNHGYIHEEAIAGELAGQFFLANGKSRIAQVYLLDARHAFLRWGATAKVSDLDERFGDLYADTPGQGTQHVTTPLSTVHYSAGGELDLSTVLKASQTISGEIILEKLLSQLMRIVLENAGATKGCLIRQKDNQYVIEAEASIDREDVTVAQSGPIEESNRLSVAVVNYVVRTKESVVVSEAIQDELFRNDPYIIQTTPKSILCVPLINQGNLTAVLYLENNLTTGAFTPDRIDVLRLLSSEMAISIENASLYKNLEQANTQLEDYNQTLEQKVKERTIELAQSLEELKTAQTQLIQAEKMASLGQLAAGIAHEIKNPLNFINNFARLNKDLSDEIKESLNAWRTQATSNDPSTVHESSIEQTIEALDMLHLNAEKIHEHGERADEIVTSMLMHSRDVSDDLVEIELNAFLEEFVSLAIHGNQNHENSLDVEIIRDYDDSIGNVMLVPQGVSRVFVNLLNNSFDALEEKKTADPAFNPVLKVATKSADDTLQILVEDNGPGISQAIKEKIFEPFFSTKPTGKGTGLGLSLSYDIIVQGLGGRLDLESEEGKFARFIVTLPKVVAGS